MTLKPKILGQLLLDAGAVDPAELEAALAEQRAEPQRLGRVLVGRGTVTEAQVAEVLALQLGLPYVPAPITPDRAAVRSVPAALAWSHMVLPLALEGRTLKLAMADPLDTSAVDDVRFQTGRHVEPSVAAPAAVVDALERAYGGDHPGLPARRDRNGLSAGDVLPGEGRDADLTDLTDLAGTLTGGTPTGRVNEGLERAIRSAPVVRLVDHILRRAVEEGASDIHVEENDEDVRVRYRVDGILRRTVDLPAEARRAVLSRIKVMAGMDISVRRRAQDGQAVLDHEGRTLTLRVSTLPVSGGEKAVVRILDAGTAPRGLGELGLAGEDLRRLRALLTGGEGLILAAGPTGSGKSTTLFAALAEVDRERGNVVTLEDPVEYHLPGVNQVQVNRKAGLGFAQALRSVLRQDPDVVMVGEIRDRETAEIAMAAAVTGHLVLSTIHTTDAPGAITRLLDMGVPPFLVAGGLAGVVAQRLVRRTCPDCGNRHGQGCDACDDGYRGRTGVFQVLTMTDPLRDEITGAAATATLRALAGEAGMATLADDARRKVAESVTTPHEIARVVQAEAGAPVRCRACASAVPSGAPACPSCGRVRVRVCTCGQRLATGWRYCPWCVRKAG